MNNVDLSNLIYLTTLSTNYFAILMALLSRLAALVSCSVYRRQIANPSDKSGRLNATMCATCASSDMYAALSTVSVEISESLEMYVCCASV